MNLDAGSVSVPFESLRRVTRERKYVIEAVEGVVKGVQAAASASGADAPDTTEAAAARLDQYVQQLQGLKRKVRAFLCGGGKRARVQVCCLCVA